MSTVSTDSASAAELETPQSLQEAIDTGFLPDNEHYRLTGEFEKKKDEKPAPAKTDDTAASTEETQPGKEGATATPDPSKAAASGTAQSQQTQGRESRWQKRERELKEARAEIARLKTQSSQPERRSETQQTSQAAPETKAKVVPKPKIDDVDPKTNKPRYASYAEYEDAKDEWLKSEALREFQETSAKTAKEQQAAQAKQTIAQEWTKRVIAAEKKYPDFREVALSDKLSIKEGSVVDAFILARPNGDDVLYYLGKNPDVLQSINAMNPIDAAYALSEIAMQLAGARNGENSENGRNSSSARPVTQASRPPHQVSGTGTAAKDAVEQALEDGDFETYQRAQNAKELARFKRK